MEHGGFSGSPGTPKFDTQEIHYKPNVLFSQLSFPIFDFILHVLEKPKESRILR